MSLWLILLAMGLLAVSGLPGLFLSRRSGSGQRLATLLTMAGAVCGLVGAGLVLAGGHDAAIDLPWALPGALPGAGPGAGAGLPGATLNLQVDALSAFFLVPVFLVGGLGAIYGMGYWDQRRNQRSGRQLRLFYGLHLAALALVPLAHNALVFLVAWEAMALSAFFLITAEDRDPAVREAGWLYLIATHAGTLCLFVMFALLRHATGTFALDPVRATQAGSGLLAMVFVLALVGFGLKAGLMPLHFWLPGAHAGAPSHVSALMSGVMIKMGIYGMVRIIGLLPHPPVSWGALLLFLGAVSGVLGVVLAIGQHDLKRLLAYHSIENIGIIVMGLGLALVGRSLGRADWVVLGLAGCLLHVWNHGLFKSLLFFCAGSVIHATGTRQIDRLGGLAKSMPHTALLFMVGAVAICGLPPLNGFVSEFLIYLGLFRTLGGGGAAGSAPGWPGGALAVPALAMIGALAVACFVKVFGGVFLGAARSCDAQHAHEAPASMIGPMAVLAGCCGLIGLAPVLILPVLNRAVGAWIGGGADLEPLGALAPLRAITFAALGLTGVILGGMAVMTLVLKRRPQRQLGTWDCGYAAPSARMQYTASSFAQMLAWLFDWVLHSRSHEPEVVGLFPQKTSFSTHARDLVFDGVIVPVRQAVGRVTGWFRLMHQGQIQYYLVYILLALLVLLLSIIPVYDWLAGMLAR